ncbi:hypothetical protein P88_00420 [Erwinia phage phiEt88]|uniref:hypothetical protein n=1 Tax=Erwinia phage phiEt88 TaxID=925984 RepID=UPI0001F1FC7A|nr:hypothetical protein ErPhphiEt88_gp42 [Erwinia phage phiEt88]CBX44553.1 hypothetical protein P88_00420 [Erwinia phage phiEt88]
MKLTIRDNREIYSIIKNLSEGDLEIIREQVDYLSKRRNPISDAIEKFAEPLFKNRVTESLESDFDYQEIIDDCLDKALVIICKRDYAISLWCNENSRSYDEVA